MAISYVPQAFQVLADPMWTQIVGGDYVFETDHGPINSGLLDVNGVPLYRVQRPEPIGFDLRVKEGRG